MMVSAMLLAAAPAFAQVKVSGRVYDMSRSVPLASVSVMSTSGTGTVTDSTGRYMIVAHENDSIWFSYLGKPTPKYPIQTIGNIHNFEVSLHVNVTELKRVFIAPPNYRMDSIQNRRDYADVFNYKKPGIDVALAPGGGAGLDINQFIEMFQFRRNKRMAAFRDRLIREEQEKYIEHRFNRALVIKITGLRGAELDTFMKRYKPDLLFVDTATDYEMALYIKQCYEKYVRLKQVLNELRKEDE